MFTALVTWKTYIIEPMSGKCLCAASSHGGRQKGKGGGEGENHTGFLVISPGNFLPTLHLNVPSINTIIVTTKISALKKKLERTNI